MRRGGLVSIFGMCFMVLVMGAPVTVSSNFARSCAVPRVWLGLLAGIGSLEAFKGMDDRHLYGTRGALLSQSVLQFCSFRCEGCLLLLCLRVPATVNRDGHSAPGTCAQRRQTQPGLSRVKGCQSKAPWLQAVTRAMQIDILCSSLQRPALGMQPRQAAPAETQPPAVRDAQQHQGA